MNLAQIVDDLLHGKVDFGQTDGRTDRRADGGEGG